MAEFKELKWSKTQQEIDRRDGEVFWQIERGPQLRRGWLGRSQRAARAAVIVADASIRAETARQFEAGRRVQDAVVCISHNDEVKVGVNEDGEEHLFGVVKGDQRPAVAVGRPDIDRIASLGLWLPDQGELILPGTTSIVETSVEVGDLKTEERFTHVPLVELPDF